MCKDGLFLGLLMLKLVILSVTSLTNILLNLRYENEIDQIYSISLCVMNWQTCSFDFFASANAHAACIRARQYLSSCCRISLMAR